MGLDERTGHEKAQNACGPATFQTLLLPPSLVEWPLAKHLESFLLVPAAELALSGFYAFYEAIDPRGVKAYEQRM